MRFSRIFLSAFSLFIFLSAAVLAKEPSLWAVEDEDTTIFIFGTIHIMDEGTDWFTPKIKEAFQNSEALVLELSPKESRPEVVQPLFAHYGMIPAGETVFDWLNEENREALRATLSRYGAPASSFNRFKPWAISAALSLQVAATHGYLPQYGVDKNLERRALSRGIPVYGLETAEDQLSMLGGLSRETQNFMLKTTLEELENLDSLFRKLRNAWLIGDEKTLDDLLNEDIEEAPDYAEAILYARNRAWMEKIKELLETPGTFFIAVGAGHLVGEKSLPDYLEREGFTVALQK